LIFLSPFIFSFFTFVLYLFFTYVISSLAYPNLLRNKRLIVVFVVYAVNICQESVGLASIIINRNSNREATRRDKKVMEFHQNAVL
jgi:hypothetical protein